MSAAPKHTPNDNSTIISLQEIFRLEERRTSTEQQEAKARAERLALQRESQRQAELERQRATEEQRMARERQAAEEASRLAGMMLGFIMRARLEAEAREREQCAMAEHSRQLELEAARRSSTERRLRAFAATATVLAVVAVAAMAIAFFVVIEPSAEHKLALVQHAVAQRDLTITELHTQVDQADERSYRLMQGLAAANLKVASLQAKLEGAGSEAIGPTKPTPVGGRPTPQVPPQDPALVRGDCAQGDPLCAH